VRAFCAGLAATRVRVCFLDCSEAVLSRIAFVDDALGNQRRVRKTAGATPHTPGNAYHRPARRCTRRTRGHAPRLLLARSPGAAPTLSLARDEEADLAIVGGGFTGLWAALLAAEASPGRDIVVLEASRIGEGASGRNGGFADPSLSHGLANGLMHFPEEMDTLVELGNRNYAELLSSLDRYGIDAGHEESGKLEVATDSALVPDLREYLETVEHFGGQAVWLEREAVRAELASPTYHAGVWVKRGGGGIVDPAKLCWGLQRAVAAHSVRVFEGTSVQSLTPTRQGIDLHTAKGRVRARKVLLATNAFRSPLRRMRAAVVPVWDYALMSERLSPSQRAAIGWANRQGVGDTTNQFHYYRLTEDDRILWGGYDAIYHYGSGLLKQHEQRTETSQLLARQFFETFPQLAGLRFSHEWGGPIATTTRFCMDTGSAFGGRVAWAIGYTGLGVVASRFGAQIALDRLDHPDDSRLKLRLARRRAMPWPPEPLRYLAIQLTRHELGRADRNGGRRGIWLRLLDRLGLGFDS
jgi:glycine/D-amino acid oxidase-like deaminating enzyme